MLTSQILTKDSVTVFVNAVMYYRVSDAESAVNEVDDYAESAKFISSTTLRNILGTKTLGEILSETDDIAREIKVTIKCRERLDGSIYFAFRLS